MEVSDYFKNSVMIRRPYLTITMCEAVVNQPHHKVIQADGRVQFWGYVAEYDKWLRVVTLDDEKTLFNAFFDRGYKP